MVNDIAVQDFVNAIKETPTDTNTTYQATVSRIDDEGVVWVCIHGSEKETPTASTSAEVKRGDSVTVQWRSNKLYIGGNYSNPSAGIGTVMPSVDFVTELIDKDITVNSINAATGYIGELASKKITAEDITADHATIKELDVESMAAATAYIRELTADNITAEDIATDHATVGNLDANYAQINAANVTDLSAQNAWVNKIMIQTGLLAHEGAVFTLDAIQVNAANITAGTIDVNRLIVTVDGEKYLVEIDPTTHQPSYEKLDGGIVEPRTITADKIVAHDITVQEITTENLVGTNGWINLNLGRFFYGNGANYASSTNAIDWNGTTLKIKGDIGDSVIFNNYSTTTEMNTAIGTAVDGIAVGGRNLATGTAKTVTVTTAAGQSWFSPMPYPISNYGGTAIADTSNIQYTVSCDYSISGVDTVCSIGASLKSTSSSWQSGGIIVTNIPVGSSSGHAKGTFNINDGARQYAVGQGVLFYRTGDLSVNTGISLTISNLKVEIGNKATSWTPAPEDIKAIHVLDSAYLSTGQPYATILGWCEGNADVERNFDINTTTTPLTGVKVGDTVRIKYFANDMGANGTIVYLVGTVSSVGANNSSLGIKFISLESTVIDGGHILTGTLDASKVNVTNLNASNINSGTISTSRLPSDALKTIRTIERSAGDTYAAIKGWAATDPCQWTTIVDTTGVRVGDTCRLAIPVTDMSGVTAYITGTVTAVPSKTALTMTGQSISSTTIDGGMILTGKVAASYIDTDHITIGQSQVTNLSTDLNSIKAQYGYTDTAAGTAAKEVVLANYVDRVGAIIGVRFANGNTVSPITLNVNGTGAKTVQSVDPINDLPAATTCNFIRDEFNQWRYLGSDASSRVSKVYASALSSAKQISTYTRSFTKANWDTYGANGHTESWSASSSSGFDNTHISVGDKAYLTGQVSDKAGWHAAILGTVTAVSTTAVIMTSIKVLYNSAQTEKYVTKIDESGILISPSGNKPSASAPQNSIKIDGNGLNVYKGGVSVASYGDYARVGKENAQRVETRSDGVYIFDNNSIQVGYYGTAYARLGDYNGRNIRIIPSGTDAGIHFNSSQNNVVASFGATTTIGKASDTNIVITPASTDSGIKMNVKNSAGTSSVRIADIGFDSTQGYETDHNFPKGSWYTLGYRAGTTTQRGYYSLVAGFNNIASHNASVAFGINNNVYAPCGFAVGINNTVGDSSKTSQNSYTASKIGNCCAVMGYGLQTGSAENQLVCGCYNQVDTSAGFIVGGGSASTRYNLFNVGSDRIYHGTHTVPSTTSTSTSTGFYLGVKANRWLQLYSWSAVNTGSDGKRKDVLGDIDFAKELIMGLEPVEFQWKDSDHIRSHMGFIAQDAAKVGKSLGKDLSFYEASYIDESKGDYHGEDVPDEELSWGMMYDELIAPLVKVVQMQQKEIDQLKIELKYIEDEVTK